MHAHSTVACDRVSGAFAPPHAYLPFRKAAVLGAGTMGAQIAAHLANAGLQVFLFDVPAEEGKNRNAIVERGLKAASQLKPAPFFDEAALRRVEPGNFEDHLDRLSDVEWVIEAVVEQLDAKRALFERVESIIRPGTIVSTNTSGLSVEQIAAGRGEAFRHAFLGTHFFNPPRYLRLLELIPSPDTDPDILARIAHFGRIHLGKSIVVAKDTPYFIGNRIGVYGMMQAVRGFTEQGYTIEEIDALTGQLVGRPRSATFRTADVVGLDVLWAVARNLHEAVADDESRAAFSPPELLGRLVQAGRLGQKTRAGFYRKEDGEIKSVDPETLEYSSARPILLPGLKKIRKLRTTGDRLRALYESRGRAGAFVRGTTLDLLAYAARRIPEISDRPADVDRAVRWGFGWELGPFEMWDAIGVERVLKDLKDAGLEAPAWVDDAVRAGGFYRDDAGARTVYVPGSEGYTSDPVPEDYVALASIRSEEGRTLWESGAAGLLDLGDGVALLEFRSKANTLGKGVMEAVVHAIEHVEADRSLKGLVIGNEGRNFSVGANLLELGAALKLRGVKVVDRHIKAFQETIQRVRYARKPVVVAAHGRVLGGGCELLMACPNQVASAECYAGLVELGVGLIPGGTGTMRLAAEASRRAASGHPSEIQSWVRQFFETVAMSRVSSGAVEARQLGFLAPHARIVMHDDRRLHVAREEVLRLSAAGYRPPVPTSIRVLGRPGGAVLDVMVLQFVEGRFISEYDALLAGRLAFAMTGGDLTAPQEVDEQYLIDLERSVFLELIREKKTQARIAHMLKTKKPLRN